jgi:hypothetical protein
MVLWQRVPVSCVPVRVGPWTIGPCSMRPNLSRIKMDYASLYWYVGYIGTKWTWIIGPMVNPLTTKADSCSDWAKIFSVASFIYLKNNIFWLDFLSCTVKRLLAIIYFSFLRMSYILSLMSAHSSWNCSDISYTYWDDSLILPWHLSLRDIYLWDILLWVLLLWDILL